MNHIERNNKTNLPLELQKELKNFLNEKADKSFLFFFPEGQSKILDCVNLDAIDGNAQLLDSLVASFNMKNKTTFKLKDAILFLTRECSCPYTIFINQNERNKLLLKPSFRSDL